MATRRFLAAAAAAIAGRRAISHSATTPLLLSLTSTPRNSLPHSYTTRLAHFSSPTTPPTPPGDSGVDEDYSEEYEEVSEEEKDTVEGAGWGGEEDGAEIGSRRGVRISGKKPEEKVAEAAEIGYTVVGPLEESDSPFKHYEPVFAVVQIGSHQFKVSNGDSIFTERLKYCEVNDKLILNKVLLLGSRSQTIIGRPTLAEAAVHAVVEEHALDAKVIIFKKKRRKNYRRTKGHRQELTKLRITDIQGIAKARQPHPVMC